VVGFSSSYDSEKAIPIGVVVVIGDCGGRAKDSIVVEGGGRGGSAEFEKNVGLA
jgi:hypothetical protein